MKVRAEVPGEWSAVYALNEAAFETPAEANLVDALRKQAGPYISIVAEEEGAIVGHIMFTQVALTGHPALQIPELLLGYT